MRSKCRCTCRGIAQRDISEDCSEESPEVTQHFNTLTHWLPYTYYGM